MSLGRKTKRAKRLCEKHKLENEKQIEKDSNFMTSGPRTIKKRRLALDEDVLVTCDPRSG